MKVRVVSILLSLLFGAMGYRSMTCLPHFTLEPSVLQESPPVEISASRLSCKENPEMIDGDLKTVGTFTPKGTIARQREDHPKRIC